MGRSGVSTRRVDKIKRRTMTETGTGNYLEETEEFEFIMLSIHEFPGSKAWTAMLCEIGLATDYKPYLSGLWCIEPVIPQEKKINEFSVNNEKD